MAVLEITPSSAVLNMIDIKIEGEGHTLASALTERLENDPSCLFVAYKIHHPNDTSVIITVKGSDDRSAKDVFKQAVFSLVEDVEDLIRQLKNS